MMVMGIISLVAGVAGAASSARAQKQAGEAQEEAAIAEAKAYDFNAAIADSNAKQTREKAVYEEGIQREEARKLLDKQKVRYLKSGVDITEGSPLLVMADSAAKAEKDALAIRWTGDVAATEYENQGILNRFYGQNARRTGQLQNQIAQTNANTTMLQGIGNAGSSFMSMKKGYA
jgi:hypothetical protein